MSIVHTLHPGDVACALRGDRLETLLGSCVSVILADTRRTVGAMCHIVHAGEAADPHDTRYAMPALDAMARLLMQQGFGIGYCDAWVYGGGNMFPSLVRDSGHVGGRNVAAVLERLAELGVRVVHQDLGGTAYRRLRWTIGDADPEVTSVAVEVAG